MLVIYQDGKMINLDLTNKNGLYLTRKISTNITVQKYDNIHSYSGHFPVHDGEHFSLFFGDIGHDGWTFNNSLDYWHLPNSKIPQGFHQDASSVRIGNYFWVFGGSRKYGVYQHLNIDILLT